MFKFTHSSQDYQRCIFDNGLTLVMEKVPGVRTVAVGMWLKRGSRHEVSESQGISHFMEHMLFKGSAGFDAKHLAKAMDALGGQFDAATGKENTCVVAKCIDENLDAAVALFSQILLKPDFPEGEIRRERRVILEELAMCDDDPEEWVQETILQSCWQNHPISRNILGSRRTIKHINRPMLLEHYVSSISPSEMVLVIAGNLDFQHACDLITLHFGSLPRVPHWNPDSPPAFQSGVTIMPRKLGQVHFQIAIPWISPAHPDHIEALITNTILGGNMSSRLFQTIRETHGLAYQIGSFEISFSDCGVLSLFGSTSLSFFKKALVLAGRCVRQVAMGDISSHEFQQAKLCLKGNIAMSFEGSSSRMSALMKQEVYHGRRFLTDEILEMIESVSLEEVQRFCADFLRMEAVNLVALGPFSRKYVDSQIVNFDELARSIVLK